MFEEIRATAAALTSIKAAAELAKAFVDVKGAVDVQGKVFELQRVILAAQQDALAAREEQATLVERIRNLENQIRDFQAWDREKERYRLTEIGPGVFAYCLKPEAQGSEPLHRLCQRCFEKGHKFVLQYTGDNLGADTFECQECGAGLTVYSVEADRQKTERERKWLSRHYKPGV